ncbi:MAG: HYR domain-containing protein [Saprospiraceae bacterium]|nr:HYR domain-containing protein [Saprospiraceae bacterium]
MEKTIFTSPISNSSLSFQSKRLLSLAVLIFFTLATSIIELSAQCSLACNGLTQVSLDQYCQARVTPAMILNDTLSSCPGGQFTVTIYNKHNQPLNPRDIVTGAQAGQKLKVEIYDNISRNRCWGDILVEDKLAPVIHCGRDTIPCFFASQLKPAHYDACGWDTLILVDEIITPLPCDPLYIKQMVRRYKARDLYGNESGICNDTTLLRRFDTTKVTCPADWTKANLNPIKCKDIRYNRIPLDQRGHPSPTYTGVPTYRDTISKSPLTFATVPLWPPSDIYCNVATIYEDINLGKVGCVTKIMRMWTIREWWCSREISRVCIQLIEIVDDEAPYIHCPYPIEATTDGNYRCEGTVYMPPAIVFDSCGGPVRVDIVYPGGILTNQNGGSIKLPVGYHRVVYRAYDECYNVDSCIVDVTVRDKTAPVVICDRETVVALSLDGRAHVYAKTFDDGSYDDCHIDSFLVRRMNDGPCDGDNLPDPFRPYVEFCCEDVGQIITVVFRAKDKWGNTNDCMVQVEVQDKLRPICRPPVDLTVACDYHFSINDLTVFGVIQTDSAYLYNTRTIRYVKNCYNQDTVFKIHDGFAHDNCDLTIRTWHDDNRTQCNTGYIVRYWEVSDRNGRDTCSQYIYFHNYCPFKLDSHIVWPADTTLTGCLDPNTLSADVTGRPRAIYEDKCDLVAFSMKDEVFRIVNGADACYKILRKWKAIDWCQFYYNSSTHQYEFDQKEYIQVIKVHNLEAPDMFGSFTDTTFCTFDSCLNGPVVLVVTGDDDCTPPSELFWEYHIDFDRNGKYDIVNNGVGSEINASGRYKLGHHTIKYVFEDKCGNKTTRFRDFSIVNCKQPTPYCLNGVAIDLMPMDLDGDGAIDTAMICVWASDLDRGSYHPCGNRVTFSFSSDTTDKSICYGCDSIGQRTVLMWVTDVTTGEQAYCRTFIDVQDNNRACRRNLTGNVTGLIAATTSNGHEPVKSVEVNLEGSSASAIKTNESGRYAFMSMDLNGAKYTVRPYKNDDHGNGISTADIVRIQKHILGLENLSDPYLIIAADVNDSKTITTTDIIELRKLILGQTTQFAKNTSWVFVDKSYTFEEKEDAVLYENYPKHFEINSFDRDMSANFQAIKIGDLNGSVVANGVASKSRTRESMSAITNEKSFIAGDELTVPIQFAAAKPYLGMQFTIQFDPTVLEYSDVITYSEFLSKENFGINKANSGFITMSLNSIRGTAIENPGDLFAVKFRALSTGKLSSHIQINSSITPAEAYGLNLEEMNIRLGFRNGAVVTEQPGFVLYQNQPNPFSDLTVIGFEMPRASHATLTVYDLNSKIIWKTSMQAIKGYNSMQINHAQLGVTGVLFYQLDADGYSATRRMVVIQ